MARSWLRIAIVVGLAAALIQLRPDWFPPRDFVEYYSAAKVFAGGGNPYDGEQLLPIQRELTGNPDLKLAVSLWTPPYTLALYAPFGGLPFATAHFLWLLAQVFFLALSVEWLAGYYFFLPSPFGGKSGDRPFVADASGSWFAPFIAFAFCPLFWNLHFGQNTAFLLFGLAGFLRYRAARPIVAGCFAALTAIKPHLLALFGILLILDVYRGSGRKALAGGIGVLGLGALFALVQQPKIFEWFSAAVRRPDPPGATALADWQVPLLSFELRHAIDPYRFGIQFVPLAVAAGALIVWQRARRIDWSTMAPLSVLVSCLIAPYGGWIFDLTVLLVPIFAVVFLPSPLGDKFRKRNQLLTALGLLIVSWFGFRIGGLAEPIWFTPAVAAILGYGWYRSRSKNPKLNGSDTAHGATA